MLEIELAGAVEAVAFLGNRHGDERGVGSAEAAAHGGRVLRGHEHLADRTDHAHRRCLVELDQCVQPVLRCQCVAHRRGFQGDGADGAASHPVRGGDRSSTPGARDGMRRVRSARCQYACSLDRSQGRSTSGGAFASVRSLQASQSSSHRCRRSAAEPSGWPFRPPSQCHSGFPNRDLALAVALGASLAARGGVNHQLEELLRELVHASAREQRCRRQNRSNAAWLARARCCSKSSALAPESRAACHARW